jgi:hypothetical protein
MAQSLNHKRHDYLIKKMILGAGLICLSSIALTQSNNEFYGNARLLNLEDDGFRVI